MRARFPTSSVASLAVLLLVGIGLAGCDSMGPGAKLSESGPAQSADKASFFEATNTLAGRMEAMGKSVAMIRSGGPAATTSAASASGTSLSLTSVAQIDPPGDTTRASHLTYSGGTVYAGYKALGAPFKGGIDILDATDPTNILDVNSLGSDNVDVQEVAYDGDENALYVAAAADPSTFAGESPSLLTKVTNFGSPTTSSVGLAGKVGKSVVIAPDGDPSHDVYAVTDEETLYRFDAGLDSEATEEVQGAEFRSVTATSNDIFAVDRAAKAYSSSIQSPGGLTVEKNVSSGVDELAIGRLHARDEAVLNGARLFLALGSEGMAVLDASSGDVLFRKSGPPYGTYYTSVTLHHDDPAVSNAPTDLVYAARQDGVIDVFRVGTGGIDAGDQSTGLEEVGTFDLGTLDGVDFGTSPQVNQVMGVGCNVYIANSNVGVVALEIGGTQGCGGAGGGNQAPTAGDDSDNTTAGQSTTTDVLANDSDPDGSLDPSTVTVQAVPSDGSATVNSDGTIDYTADSGFTGSDSYTYTVKDGDGAESGEATVTITVNEDNQAPTVSDDSDQTTEDQPTTTDVLVNDSDPDGSLDPATVQVQGGPSNGTVNVDGSTGAITYTPDTDFTGSDSYTYTVGDGDGATSDPATVSIAVNATNAATAGCKGAIGGGIAFTASDGDLQTLSSDDGATAELLSTSPNTPVLALGTGVDLDDDGNVGVVYVQKNANGAAVQTLKVIDANDGQPSTFPLPVAAKTSKTLLGVGSWSGSGPSAFYVAKTGNGDEIFRVPFDGSSVQRVANPANGVDAILGVADINGDDQSELVFTDGSQQTRYVKQSDGETASFTKVPGAGAGSNNNIGIGSCLADVDGDGSASIPFIDGSNQVRLADAGGAHTTLIAGSDDEQAAKTPLAWAEVDNDGETELVYLENNNSPAELKYVDDIGGANTFEVLRDAAGSKVEASTSAGVVSAQ